MEVRYYMAFIVWCVILTAHTAVVCIAYRCLECIVTHVSGQICRPDACRTSVF